MAAKPIDKKRRVLRDEDPSGKKYGKLTAVEFVRMHGSFPIWKFLCDCGTTVEKRLHKAVSGHTKSCGCLLKEKNQSRKLDLPGSIFGRLTVVGYAGDSKWHCRCECGGSTTSSTSNLRSGDSTSCGCKRVDGLIASAQEIVGRRFGRLVVLSDAKKVGNYLMAACRCDCGKESIVARESLFNENTVSCGCAHKLSRRTPFRSLAKREDSAARSHKRRVKIQSVGGDFDAADIRRLYRLQRGKCASCRTGLGEKYHRDHIMPLALGGANTIHNIQLLCQHCNQVKASKHPIAWAQEQGRLL